MQTLLDLSIPGLKFIPTEDGINHWYVDINIVDNPIYDPAHAFRLEIVAGDEYPIEPPMVKFIGQEIPLHPHVYSNGHICLNILGDGWTPAQSIRSIALSIQSMLQGNTKNGKLVQFNSLLYAF